ncbi:uncharacterized protein DUF4250 [Mobilisporobacter senegalensis]|uniref:Uncharacterized protein DUF4250 n=1 Tax=Mobilisporobacter senegalensis TaxID=1329262 RepID=A0A3N1XZJ0_9FIRM|nr:DUF4250 domain-containing protein [Mobilisporobacter senegalensis]ROR30357.1 uncharacterized protein DUF4250 [Mobilisporobacter senegalensis]
MLLPKDPVILLSYVNTQLRDFYENLEDFCKTNGINQEDLENTLKSINYSYDIQNNQFK